MSTITIKKFAEQVNLDPERLVKQLNEAGVKGKSVDDELDDAQKRQLLDYLRSGSAATATKTLGGARSKITVNRKTTSEIKQKSRTGTTRTVQVEVKKKRTFIKREVLVEQEQERLQQEEAERVEQERLVIEQEENSRLEAEQKAQAEEQAAIEAKELAEQKAELERQQAEQEELEAQKRQEQEAAQAAEQEVIAEEAATDTEETVVETSSKAEDTTDTIEEETVEAVTEVKEEPVVKQEQPKEQEPPKAQVQQPPQERVRVVLQSGLPPSRPAKQRKQDIKPKSVVAPKEPEQTTKRKLPRAIIKEAPPKPAQPAAKPVAKTTADTKKAGTDQRAPNSNDNNRGKKRGKGGRGREELHVAKGRRGRIQQRRPNNITSSSADMHGFERPTAPVIHEVEIPENISVADLAQAMSVKSNELIKVLFNMGTMVTINQTLDRDTATLVVEEMGHTAVDAKQTDPEAFLQKEEEQVDESMLSPRSAVVTVMGHVDHGKTSLLDYIRKAKIAQGEAGGITQHIGAYKVATSNGDVTFLDTPGHEAFSAMRARGAQATDLVILVVAADDGVKPQTIEAIHHSKSADVPMVVAINKMDKEDADPERVKQELATHEVIPEDWGGDVMMIPVSAHTGEGVDQLLDSLALQSEILELKAQPTGPAKGTVVEARLDKGRGPVATILVQQGELKTGDIVLVGKETGRVRTMLDSLGKPIKTAGPSVPVEIQGLSGVPSAGDEMKVVSDERKAREAAEFRQAQEREKRLARQQAAKLENMFQNMQDGSQKVVNVLIKADVQGSIEALSESLIKLSTDAVKVSVIHGMVGGINESDVNLAMASSGIVVGFNVRADATARKLAEVEDVEIRYYSIIYDVIDDVRSAMEGLLDPDIKEEVLGYVEVRDVFKAPKIGAIAGSYVTEGMVKRNAEVRVLRDDVVIFEGTIDSLRRFKDDVTEVKANTECGIGVKNYSDIKVGDQLEIFEKVEVKATL